MANGRADANEQPQGGEVDDSLIDEMLAWSPEERLRHNDRMLRTIELLRQGMAEKKTGENGR